MTRSHMVSALAAGLLTIATAAGASAETLVVCTEASPDFLNPQFSNQNTAYDVSTQIYERLVGVERGGSKLVPSLAESWSDSDDGLIVTFKLRPGVKWHSNRHFTPTRNLNADDVVYTFRRMMDERDPYAKVGGVNYQFFGTIIQPTLERVEKVDDLTVRLVLKRPQAALLGALSVDLISILGPRPRASRTAPRR